MAPCLNDDAQLIRDSYPPPADILVLQAAILLTAAMLSSRSIMLQGPKSSKKPLAVPKSPPGVESGRGHGNKE